MAIINYKIEFFSDWHCGSGLAAGADVDLLVVKDSDEMPFVPGKTIKGLLHEAVDNYCQFSGTTCDIDNIFGSFDDKNGKKIGCVFFSNATLCEHEHKEIVNNNAQSFMYRQIASTKIGDNGIAVDHSLRKMEVTVPCTVIGEITDMPSDMVEIIKQSLCLIKRLGQNRNRGLGRCKFSVIEKKEVDK